MKRLLVGSALLAVPFLAPAAGKQLTGQHAPATSLPLPAAEAQKKFVVPDGFEVRLFAAEPDVVNPVAMTWDERGRLWVLELYEYPLGAPPGVKPRDRIRILEDTDNDGRADKVTVFADGLNLATGLLLGNGGVYVGQAPDLLFLRDTNHDDVADTREVLLTGFGLEDRHELLNGFCWGPDGGLYLTHGVFTHSKVKIPEASAPGIDVTAAIARYQPGAKRFEVFADGTSNPWGVDFDCDGNAFVSACVIDHLFHMAPGGIYVRQGGTPANPYAYELLPSIVDHKHHMAAYCGVCVYQGDQFPDEYRGHVFMGNIHQNAINHDRLIPNGSSFKAVAEKDFLTTSDGWFRPISEQVGPDGALWIADWYDKYPCYQNAQADPEGVDREHGRIWRVVYTGKKSSRKLGSRPDTTMDLTKLSSPQLVQLLENPNIWQRRMAQRILSERRDLNARDLLKQMLASERRTESRLSALWTLHSSGQLDEATLDMLLHDKAAPIRSWVARLTGERGLGGEMVTSRLKTLANDRDASVRLAVATAARQFASESLTVDTPCATPDGVALGEILAELVGSSSDARDPLIPFMIWMAGEPMIASRPQFALDWLSENGPETLPLSAGLVRKAMRRICDTQANDKINLTVGFLERISGSDLTTAALDGLIQGQEAKPLPPGPDTTSLFKRLSGSDSPKIRERALELGVLWGNSASIQATIKAVTDSALPVERRKRSIHSIGHLGTDAARDAVMKVIDAGRPDDLVSEAIHAMGELGGDTAGAEVLKDWKTFSPALRLIAADVLVTRRAWAIALLGAIEVKAVSTTEISPSAIRALTSSKDDAIQQRALLVIGRVRPPDADKQKLIARKKQMILAGGTPDPQTGHELAKKTCFVCHKLNGEGVDVGPDLTGVGRSSLDALLANVIDPNQVIGKGYENVEVETKDGRSLNGRLVEDTSTEVTLRSAGPKEEVVARSDIVSMRVSELSVMPEGLEQMPDSDFRNLILFILDAPSQPTESSRANSR